MVKTEEFQFHNNLDLVKPMLHNLQPDGTVPYEQLKTLIMPPVHYKEKTCPPACPQQPECLRIRETVELVELIVAKLKKFDIFQSIEMQVCGSIKEQTRAFYVNEIDIHLAIIRKPAAFLEFDLINHGRCAYTE